ncbi:LysR family transcriptional regulator [Burkholderia guangdongensis]|uniref:LysR family transcriptional regulator n=1 Tax=Burkholderia guangdongensis TaxID=1792500 RepID=UPI0015C6D446|nr:LysR family transcriptional regulator [Burkholderia guangdongensis]
MDIRKLQHVVALADTLHFGRACEQVNLSQPAFSRSIRALEDELGVALFERDAHGVQITPYGQTVVARARRMLFDAVQMRDELHHMTQGGYGEVTVGLGATPARLLAARLLEEGSRLVDGSHVRIRRGATERLLAMLNDGLLDFFCADIAPLDVLEDRGNLEIRPLPEWPVGFFCRIDHPLPPEQAVSLNTLTRYPIASTSLSPFALSNLQRASALKVSFATRITMESDSLEDIVLATMRSDAVLLASRPVVWSELRDGKLREIGIAPPLGGRGGRFGIVTRAGAKPTPLAARLTGIVADTFDRFAQAF